MVFAGFDGRIHAVSSTAESLWSVSYTQDSRVLTGGVVVADLSGDGTPEIVLNSYSPDPGKGQLLILDAGGNKHHTIDLPERGAMPVPTVADVNGDGQLEIVVSLKDSEEGTREVLIYTVPGSADNCMPWATGRGNLRRDGYIPAS
ncbi:MAG: VCBS repeat-containing protein [Myxococcota bacterium]